MILMTATSLPSELKTSDMLVIDGLHAFDFDFDEHQLLIKSMDGRAEKRWTFSAAQVQAATFDEGLQSWTLTGDSGEHRLVCMSAVTGNNDDEEDEHADA
jgi:hypothetical protein